ncbi:hypothetical protein ACQP08_08575 [Micromonospora zamorensis]|nr:hypothetical protein OHA01_15445 [Micromonospora zamorensis]WTI18822.1 hypothetical protein OG886_17620 [Micromonospora zamorensis]
MPGTPVRDLRPGTHTVVPGMIILLAGALSVALATSAARRVPQRH